MPDIPDLPVVTGSDDGDDDGSLFGSPPSSPARGRSPSPLALPGGPGSAQNVGALALPGSHLVAELPTNPPASLPLSASAYAPNESRTPRRQAPPGAPQASLRAPPRASSSRRSTPSLPRSAQPDRPLRKTRKGKEKASTPRPTPPPIALPSPDKPPPPNFLRNQQALLGLAGMVGGVHPANLSKARHTRGATAENPIVVEDEPQVQQQPCIGRRPTHPAPSDPSQLPPPTSEQILRTLLKQKNIFPVVISLLRLLAPGSPSLASVPPGYPHYPYPNSYSSPYPPGPSQGQGQTHAPSPSASEENRPPTSSSGAPPLKRRKLNNVPAGAADWDVPYPFQHGHGPENYRVAWEQERGGRLLKDLVQLVQNAARKAATKAWYQQQIRPTVPISPALKYYRPETMYYGLDRKQSAPSLPSQSQHQVVLGGNQTSGSSTPQNGAYTSLNGLPHTPSVSVPPSASVPVGANAANEPLNAFEQLVETLLAAQQQHPAASASSPQACASPPPSSSGTPSGTALHALDENTQAFFDNWLVSLTTFPPGDPNDASVGTSPPATSTCPVSHPAPTSFSSMSTQGGPMQISDDLIDPTLLDVPVGLPIFAASSPSPPSGSAGEQSHAASNPTVALEPCTATNAAGSNTTGANVAGHATSPTNVQPATPSLVDSPSVTVSSLADTADRDGDAGPTTPSWRDWGFPDPQELEASIKLLDELAGMDVEADVGAAMDLDMDGWQDVLSATDGQGTLPSAAAPAEGTVQQEPLGLDVGALTQPIPHPEHDNGQTTAVLDDLPTSRESLPDPHASQPDPSVHPAISPPYAPEVSTASTSVAAHPPAPPPFPTHTVPSPAVTVPLTDVSLPLLAAAVQAPAPARSARAKGKAKAIPGVGNGIVHGTATGKQDKRAILEKARAMRTALAKEVERAKVALWETTLEQGVLVGFGRELEKEKGPQ